MQLYTDRGKSVKVTKQQVSNVKVGLSYLVVLNFTTHHPEGVVAGMVIDVDSAETCGTTSRDPFLVGVIIHHDSSPCLTYALLTAK